jgi:hypothetical protein
MSYLRCYCDIGNKSISRFVYTTSRYQIWVPVKCEMKRETKYTETERNEIYRNETERNETKCTQKLEGNEGLCMGPI